MDDDRRIDHARSIVTRALQHELARTGADVPVPQQVPEVGAAVAAALWLADVADEFQATAGCVRRLREACSEYEAALTSAVLVLSPRDEPAPKRPPPTRPADLPPDAQTCSIAAAALVLDVSTKHCERMARCGRLVGAFKTGHTWRVPLPVRLLPPDSPRGRRRRATGAEGMQ